ncbi:MAG TPA: S4 domain-containing protein YaaA [Bacillus bacterium]|nr:S4 domain-containing protein YaaA [Bacillus sp. (in: firmicutes)]
MTNEVPISTETITLGQFLKLAGIIDTGGAVKWFLSEHEVFVNGQPENRRGKKLYHHDEVTVSGKGSYKVISSTVREV